MNVLFSRKTLTAFGLALPLAASSLYAPALMAQMGPGPRGGGPPLDRALAAGRHGRWWDNPATAQQIGITSQQQAKMDSIFQEHRLKLIDMQGALEKQETILEPLLQPSQLDKSKVLSQIDAVADARAALEKANARMLLDLREVLSPEQWQKLQAIAPMPPMRGPDFRHHGPGGPGDGPPPPPAPPQQ
ncbi:periplasmic heavy metal sensor [Acidipila rosea]|uniref:Spy/CpxP family protein refolding chaperone n=1 Tax=Acidipila rosea TaxID=768535 RepID=A0A4R1L2H8_9BACT|nr:periplasmic heavy metal sensor [Acidipila rosea]MBW4027913.1 periplasmic heavy metal sensor [Acidobacteriota bacterium]MBW4045286.1 periplasmic heavy metal sensor [Acidobacteriota bacterium]TCK72124.1 Spy/CpxP family protein refolding chaperone [Acidipila rosea]